jgi:hypothetical protein
VLIIAIMTYKQLSLSDGLSIKHDIVRIAATL